MCLIYFTLKVTLKKGIEIEDIVVGDGDEVTDGDSVIVEYKGRLESVDEDNPMLGSYGKREIKVGAKGNLECWNIGLQGMKMGGIRKMFCPSKTAYGAKGIPPFVPPNANIIFEMNLITYKCEQ